MSKPADIPNFFDDREPWEIVKFGGAPVRAALTAINGVKTVDAWQKQKSKETSGQVAVFQGTTWGDPELTFIGVDAADFDDLRALWTLLAPTPGMGTGTGTVSKSPQTSVVGSVPSKKDDSASSSSGAAGGNFAIPNNEPAKVQSVGPRPPTISVQHPILAWHGITACARMEWEGPTPTETNGLEVKIKLIADKPPKPAGTGAMGPAKGDAFSGGVPNSKDDAGQPTAPTDKINKNAAAGAGGF